ncbi:hypothetical protein DFH05DRAFT_1468466, partial [Lentinula detonsa]
MKFKSIRGYGADYYDSSFSSSHNLLHAYNGSMSQEGVPQSQDADPYTEEYPTMQVQNLRNYQVEYEARNEHSIYSVNHSQQQHNFERPHSRAYANWSNRSPGRHDHPTIQPDRIPVPDSAYLHLSEQSSVRLTDPTERRKLLILDLNGTLLYREPRAREGRDPYATNEPRQLRPTHPRPYIPSFKAFLFHPATRKWLDTMVWSSAQYANVKDMVGRCFGEEQVEEYVEQVQATTEGTRSEKEGLVAIWDRKFLGLSELQYRNKFQTTKNLAKPWALLPLSTLSGPTKVLSEAWDRVAKDEADLKTVSGSSNVNSESRLNNASFLDSLIEESDFTRKELLTHSAFSTLLLDDSPLKARMQPYNHICVPEYEGNFFKNVTRAGTGKRKRSRSPSPTASPRFRKKQKELDAENLSQHHDHILLAVIGLLDALQHESNVAAWIKRKGLFATRGSEDIGVELDGLYRNSIPEGVDGVAQSTKKKKERWRNSRQSGRHSGMSATSLGSEQSWIDGSMSFTESGEGNGNDTGFVRDNLVKDEGHENYPSFSQHTEPASRPITPEPRNTSGATTLPPSPPSARLRQDLARKRHLLPRQERRDVPRPYRRSRQSTPNFADSIYLYGKDADTSYHSRAGSTSSLDFTTHVSHNLGSIYGEKDIFSDPHASPPGLTGRELDVEESDVPVENASVEPNGIESPIAPTSNSEVPPHPLPSLWYQHPPTRQYWVRRGVRALKELGLQVIPGVET